LRKSFSMWLKWTKRIVAAIGILIFLVVAFALTVIYVYEDEIKEFATQQLNKNLKVKVQVKSEDIELTLWDQFPNASLRFKNVLIPDYTSENNADTLLYAQSIYLSFDFWDMYAGNYKVKKIHIASAVANIKTLEDNISNYDVWKADTTKNEHGNKFSFHLEELTGENIRLSYTNVPNNQKYALTTEQILFSGKFSEQTYQMSATSDMIINTLQIDSIDILTDKKANLDFGMLIDNETKSYAIQKGNLTIEEIIFDVKGVFQSKKDSSNIDIAIKGKNIDLESAFTIFPKEYLAPLQKYDAKGMVVFDAQIVGRTNNGYTPRIKADFYIDKGSVKEKTSNVTLTNIDLEGYYDSDTNAISILEIANLSANMDVGTINGSLKITDLSQPKVTVHSQGNINLYLLQKFLQNKSIETLEGNSQYTFDMQGKKTKTGFDLISSKGVFNFENVKLKLPSSPILYSGINGKAVLKNNDAAIQGLSGMALTSDFELDGVIKNLIPYIVSSKETMTIEADLRSKYVMLDDLMNVETSNSFTAGMNPNPEPFSLPNNINLNLKSQIKSLMFGKLNAKNINGVFTLYNRNLKASNISFKASKGVYKGDFGLEQQIDNSFIWESDISATGIDIKSLFVEMDNFGQVYLTDQNIKGKGDITLSLVVALDQFLNLKTETLIASTTLNLKKGELINQSSLMEIGAYLADNKAVNKVLDTDKLNSKLKHIKFKDLSNTITIKNSKIFIPKMLIESNVMDISISGWHSFTDSIDYHFSFRMRDVMVQKNVTEFGPVQDDGLGVKLFLKMFGTLDNPTYKIDQEERKAALKADIKQEKADMKSLLKSELGLFKNDTAVNDYVAPEKKAPTFEMDWEEFDNKDTLTEDANSDNATKAKKDRVKKDKGFNKLLKKMGIEEEEKKAPALEMEFDAD